MKLDKQNILFITPLPPPMHGSAMVSQYIKGSELIRGEFECDFVNLSTSRRIDEIGKGGAKKLLRFAGSFFLLFYKLLLHRYDLCYLAITCHGVGFLKDAPFVLLCKLFGRRIVIHQHNKGMSGCIGRWPYRCLIPYIYEHARVILLSWHLYPDIAQAVKREQVVICANGILETENGKRKTENGNLRASECRSKVYFDYAEREQIQDAKEGLNEKGERRNQKGERREENEDERLKAAEQQVNCDDSQVNVASPRLNAAEQQVNSDDSQVNAVLSRLGVNQSQGDDSPATPLRLTSSSAAINRSEATSLTAHRSPLTVNLLFLSNLIPSKGVYVLLDACKILKDCGLRFQCNFVGGESKEMDRRAFEEAVKERGLEGCVLYHGPKYGEEKEHYWSMADVFVQPTYEDCFPLTILEAMQHALPVVSTDEGAVPDMVADGENGFVCRRKDAEGLAQALERLLQDEALRHRMGAEGYRRYKEKFTLSCFEHRFTEILREMNG